MHSFILVLLLLWQKMAVPPTYADLGKSARDVFTKGYGECWRRELGALEGWRAFYLQKVFETLGGQLPAANSSQLCSQKDELPAAVRHPVV